MTARGSGGRLPRQPAAARAFAQPEPLRVRDEREIVDGDDDRRGEPERSGVGGREPDVEMIGGDGARYLHLFPPGAAAAGDRRVPETGGASSDSSIGSGSVEHEFVRPRALVGRPLPQQAAEIAADAGRPAAQFAGVYADAHGRAGH